MQWEESKICFQNETPELAARSRYMYEVSEQGELDPVQFRNGKCDRY